MQCFSVGVYLLLCAVCVDHVYIDSFIHQLVEKLPRSLYRLHKHQHGRQETLKTISPMLGQKEAEPVFTQVFSYTSLSLIVTVYLKNSS